MSDDFSPRSQSSESGPAGVSNLGLRLSTQHSARWTQHSGLGTQDLGLLFVVLVAGLVRLGFAFRPPPFLTPDSQGYFLPGWELAHGLGFGPELRRTPLYPLFISLVVLLFGDDLRGVVLAQHGLGVVTAGLTYSLGRVAFGRLAGLVAGLAAATAGPLLIYEHYVLTESLFACLLVLATLLALLALRQPTHGRLVAAGLGLAAAILVRPVAEVLLPLLPAALLVRAAGSGSWRDFARWRPALAGVGWFGLGLGLVLLPWMGRNALAHGTFSAEGALGQALIGRTVRHDDHDRFYTCPTAGSAQSQRERALLIICEEAAGEPSGGTVTQRVRDELGLSQVQTSNLLRQVALEGILGHPDYYLRGSVKMAGEILVGKRETVIAPWRERTTRNWDNKWDPRLTALVDSPPRPEGPDYEHADAIVSFFQPYRWRREIGLLLVLGSVAAVLRAGWRPALLVPAAAGLIVMASAALDGLVWRYRYPVDPLLAVTAAGGVQALWLAVRALVRRASSLPASATGFARSGTGDRSQRGAEAAERRAAEPTPLVERGT